MGLKPSSLAPNLACRVSISGLEHAVDLVAPISTGSTCGCRGGAAISIARRRNRGTTSSARQCTRLTDIRKSRRHGIGATVSTRPISLHCIAAVRINHFVVGGTREIINHIGHVARRRLTVDAGVVGKASRVARDARECTCSGDDISSCIRCRTRFGRHSRRTVFDTVNLYGGVPCCERFWHVSISAAVLTAITSLQITAV